MSHNEIASISEPWLLLPFLYAQKQYGTLAEYAHSGVYRAINTFINNLPGKQEDYNAELKKFFVALYEKQCTNNETYFLDKTPRYYLIIPEIAQLFPNAKFVFLFRNPIQIMSSIMETWCNSTFKGIHSYDIDLKRGPELLSQGYQLLKDKAYAFQYEQFVTNPEKYTTELCNYLNIPFIPEMLDNFSKQNTKGTMGDPNGTKKYKEIETQSLDKWTKTFNTIYRKKQAKKYINHLDEGHLQHQGYNRNDLLSSLEKIKPQQYSGIKDFFHIQCWKLIVKYNLNIFAGDRTSKWTKGKFLS